MDQQELTDIEQIKQLKSRYFRYLDTKDWAAWRTVFTDDLVARVDDVQEERPNLAQSGDEIVERVSGMLAGVVTVHHGHMPEITLTGPDSATGIWAMEDILEYPGGRSYQGFGHYHETYRRSANGWQIATLHLTRLRVIEKQP